MSKIDLRHIQGQRKLGPFKKPCRNVPSKTDLGVDAWTFETSPRANTEPHIRDNPLNNFFHSAHSLLKDSGIYCVISLSFSCFILNGGLVLVFSCFIFCCYFFSFPDLYLTNIWSDFGHGHLFWFWFSTWFGLGESADLVGLLVLSYDYILIQKGVIFHFV